ncbi:hypothetical protein CASFOL_035182 [Castilleja foliolosa]|uniref:Late embryogenesis abundant protein LEA-2 subgroup domain-containing protein n=1 Tax=Castilleja foliolosa TaxID=1961234 RepID=A0ABD3BS53_9LAMI
MADPQIHPSATPSSATPSSAAPPPTNSGQTPKAPNPPPSRRLTPPPSYVVQLPREQILRHPPPENATKFEELSRRKNRRSFCCYCYCCFALCLLLLLIAAAVSAASVYLIFDFKSPKYTVTNISVRKMNLTSSAPIRPEFDVSVKADNPSGNVGIYYMDSTVNIYYKGSELSYGVWPAFYQPKNNVTVLMTALTGFEVNNAVMTELRNDLRRKEVTFVVNVDAPVKFKVGSTKTWEIIVKVKCIVVVDALNEKAKIVSKDCGHNLRFW